MRDPHCGRAIGIEELRVDQIKRLLGVQPAGDRQHGAGFRRRIETPANAGQQLETRAQHRHPAALLNLSKPPQSSVTRVQ